MITPQPGIVRLLFDEFLNPMNYRIAYGAIARGSFLLNTPGPTPASVAQVNFRNVARPWFPADPEMPAAVVSVCCRDDTQ